MTSAGSSTTQLTEADLLLDLDDRLGQAADRGIVAPQDVESEALGRAPTDAGQL
jgi:hypothetical protein